MSPSIWTQCGGRSNLVRFSARPWRATEAQHVIATRKLVDSLAEQEELERIIDAHKPPRPSGPEFAGLHFLLFTPFRHPPLQNGSRFGRRHERGIWYGSDEQRTAFAEVAYYRLLFLDGTAADLGPLEVSMSVFQARVSTAAGVDLTLPPFAAHRAAISSPTSYAVAQQLGAEMRAAEVAAFRFASARDVAGGSNVALFRPAFAHKSPDTPETWFCRVSRDVVEWAPANVPSRGRHTFARAQFEVGGRLPSPAI